MPTLIQYWDEKQQKTLVREATETEVADFNRIARMAVPKSVTAAQARLALLNAGLLDAVQPAIDALPEPQRTAAQIRWDFGGTVDRDDPFTLALAPAVGLTPEQMDELFIAASGM